MDSRLIVLLRDYGYRFAAGTLTRAGIRGFTSDEVLPYTFRSVMAAAEWLCPIVADAEYTQRLMRATAGTT